MNKDFDNNIPDFSTRKKVLKLILFLLIISLAILVVQLFFKESLSFTQGNLAIINSFVAFILLFLYIVLIANMYVSIKRIKEREKVELANEFRVDAFKQTYFLISDTVILIIFIFILVLSIVLKIGIFAIIFALFGDRNIKVLYKNQEIGTFEIKDIVFVAFFGSGKQKVKIGDYPIMEIYNSKGEKVLRIPLSLKNYWLMKKYFLKYRVNVNDIYVE